jgi:hypothetical protein
MDVLRVLLCLGLAVLVWRFEIGGVRPIRDFVLWGVDHPVHFALTAIPILVIWGVVGASFGLQGLFLDEDPLTQVLLGATVMLLFAAIIVHASALGSARRGWRASLHAVAGLLRGLTAVANGERAPLASLANGFLERLTPADLDTLEQVSRPSGRDAGDATLDPALESEPFRLLLAPAVLLAHGASLVVLVGIVPAIILPLAARDPVACLERLPWLVGVAVGGVLGLVLGCRTTAWAAAAAGWTGSQDAIFASLRAAAARADAWSAPPRPSAPAPGWFTLLAWFFVVHAAVTFLLPDAVTARWIDWPEGTLAAPAEGGRAAAGTGLAFPWLPLAVLGGEAAAAAILAAATRHAPRLVDRRVAAAFDARWRSLLRGSLATLLGILRSPWFRRSAILAAAALAVASVAITLGLSSEATRSVWLGLRGYASLGAMLCCWLGSFWLATHAASGGGTRTPGEQAAAIAALAVLVAFHVAGAPGWLTGPLAGLAVAISGSRTLVGLFGGRAWLRPAVALAVMACVVGSLVVADAEGTTSVACGVWLGLAVLLLGSTALSGVAARRPAMLYPATVLLGYASFALPYAGLDERWQAAMPAAGSIACGVALLAAAYAVIGFARPRSTALAVAALAAVAILVNGMALFVTPNEFKGTFPGLASYYALPVYLDSRDYFRDTTPSTARLRSRAVTEDFDRLARQPTSERLATVFFTMRPLERTADGGHAIVIEVEDPRGRLRPLAGDGVRLAAEEWFTIRLDGDDCVALAEEPFYRRIFPWFRYETLHMIRDGVIRGPTRPLVAADTAPAGVRPAAVARTPYRLLAAGDPADPAVEMGLRLLGLAPAFREIGADYALIAFAWTGRVAAIRHEPRGDVFTVQFALPPEVTPPDASQLRTMAAWMERCHLDTLRPVATADAETRAPVRMTGAASVRADECLVLDDVRTEAPVPVGVFLGPAADPDASDAAFAPFWPTVAAIRRTIAATPPPRPGADPNATAGFTLRSALDRGLVVHVADGTGPAADAARGMTVGLYGAGRLRLGDRLILSWNGRDHSASGTSLEHGGVFDVESLAEAAPAQARGCPPGVTWARLRPVSGTGPVGGAAAGGLVVGQWQLARLLNNTEVLTAWKKLVGPRWREGKPKLVIVTVSGGGIRASVWTSVVLRKLEAALGSDFPYHVRIITGASGGMVAGSYYAASLAPPPARVLEGGTARFGDLHGTGIDEFVNRMATDQLDAVAGRMVFADLPGTLSPFRHDRDRGRTLEETWIRWTGGAESPLGRPLDAYAADERLGWRPSLVFTPMLVEDGRRLLISNLDLAFATRNVGGLLIEPSSRKIERPAIQGGDFDQSIHEEDDVFSLSAVEFYRLFPAARDFRVTTAVRMSASFPWVSPAVSIPTLPPRRVVDAGYYDNYGVNLSALWLSKMSGWLEANTSGVLVVQIRDKVSQNARTEIDFDRLGPDGSPLDRLVWHGGSRVFRPGLKGITTPLIGVTNARQWTMAFRNDEQVDLQDLLFDDERGRDFFRTVVFECPIDVSLSWRLSDREKTVLASGFGRPDASPRDELSRVADFMTGQASYEFHKWRIEHRNYATFARDLKRRYDHELAALGITGTDRLTVQESQSLYENVIQNLKRLELLGDWWSEGRAPLTAPPPR